MSETTHAEPAPASTHAEAAHADDVRKHVRVYIAVFAALAALTIVTVGVAYLDLSILPALILALLIATIKGGLVAGYFMHLLTEKKLIASLVWMTLGLLIAMFFLFTAAHFDQDGWG